MLEERIEKLRQRFVKFDLTLAEGIVLHLVYYESRPALEVPRWARGLVIACGVFQANSPDLPTAEECLRAIESLQSQHLVTVVDRFEQNRIANFVRKLDCVGPLNGIPYLGQLDFTLAGAALWRSYGTTKRENDSRPPDYYWNSCTTVVHRRNAIILYGFQCDDVYQDLGRRELIPLSPVERIGPWRMEWWHEIPDGYRIRCLPDPELKSWWE